MPFVILPGIDVDQHARIIAFQVLGAQTIPVDERPQASRSLEAVNGGDQGGGEQGGCPRRPR